MSLSALPTLLAIPPVNLLVAACAGAALRRHRYGRILLIGGLAGLSLFGLPVVSGCLTAILESGLDHVPPPPDQPQAIVILSADQQRVWQEGQTAWKVGALTLQREQKGAALARGTHLPVLVTGGSMREGAPSLAHSMAISMQDDFASPVKWQEDASQDTWQNAAYSAAILRAQGIHSIYLVTHAWHMKRALVAFRRAGLQAEPAPVQIDDEPDLRAAAFVPSAHGWQESYYMLHELIGWAWYALKP